MARGKSQQATEQGLQRTCHVCGNVVDSRVWYAKNTERRVRRKGAIEQRVYACPPCFFGLKEDERKDYYRERV